MQFVIGDKNGVPYAKGSKLLGLDLSEYPYFLVSHGFNYINSANRPGFSATIYYADGTSFTTTLSRNTSYTYNDLLFNNGTRITRIGEIELQDANTGAGKRLDPSFIQIKSKHPILTSVHHMFRFTSGQGQYPTGHNPIDLSQFNTANVTDFSEMFYKYPASTWWTFDKLDLSHLNTSNAVNFNAMIPTGYDIIILPPDDVDNFIIDLSGFDMSKAVTQDSYNIFSDNFRSFSHFAIIVDRCDEDTVGKIKWACQTRATSSHHVVSETTIDGKRAILIEWQE